MKLLASMNGEGMGISCLLVIITLGLHRRSHVLDTFIEFKAGSNNLVEFDICSMELEYVI